MPRIEWEERFSVMNSKIDEQHMKWLEIINRLHDVLMTETDPNKLKGLPSETLNEMKKYAEGHFIYEEQHMKKLGFPGLEEHVNMHNFFLSKLAIFQEMIRSSEVILNREIMKELMDWLVDHILHEDMKYSVYEYVKPKNE